MRQVIRNARLFDSAAGVLRAHSTLVIEGERIAAVTQQALQVHDVGREIDAQGRVVVPVLIDAHVHVSATSHDLAGLALQPVSLVGAESSHLMAGRPILAQAHQAIQLLMQGGREVRL